VDECSNPKHIEDLFVVCMLMLNRNWLFTGLFVGSVAERVKAPFLWRPCDSRLRDLGSTPTLIGHVVASVDKTLYDDYLCLVASNKQQIQS